MASWLSRALGLSDFTPSVDALEARLALAVGADVSTAVAAGGVLTVAGTLRNDGPEAVAVSYVTVSLSADRYAGDLDDRRLGTIVLNTSIPAGGSAAFAENFSVRRETLSPAFVVVEAKRRRSQAEINAALGGSTGFLAALYAMQYSTQMIAVGSSRTQVVIDAPGTTDADRGFSVRISGPGQAGFVADGGVFDVLLTGTTPDTGVQIRPLGGSARLGDIRVFGSLRSLSAEKTAFTGSLRVDGSVREIKLGVADGAALDLGPGPGVSIRTGSFRNGRVASEAPISGIQTGEWTSAGGGAELRAPTVGGLKVGGTFGARVEVAGATGAKFGLRSVDVSGAIDAPSAWRVAGNVESIKAGSITGATSISISGNLKKLEVARTLSGVVAAASIREVQAKGSVLGAKILAGTDLGSDGRLGGVGAAADIVGAGFIESFRADREVTSSIIGAGLDPVNGVFFDGDDVMAASTGMIRKVEVRREAAGTVFAAPNLPARVKINNRPINTATDARFVRAV